MMCGGVVRSKLYSAAILLLGFCTVPLPIVVVAGKHGVRFRERVVEFQRLESGRFGLWITVLRLLYGVVGIKRVGLCKTRVGQSVCWVLFDRLFVEFSCLE